MAVIRMLFFLGVAFVTLAEISAAPAKYDQRQDGSTNVNAKLENFLFVVAFPYNNELLSELALQALDLKQLASRSSSSKEQELIKSGEQPYSVEVIQINENQSNEDGSVRKAEGADADTSKISISKQTDKAENTERTAKNLKGFDFPKSREVPTILGYLVDTRKMPGAKMEDSGRARNVVGNVWNPDVEPGRPGTSLKKQLLRKRKEDVALPSSNADKNDVASSPEEKELWLLGDRELSIENCGPGRRRDASGICQFNGSTGFSL